MSNTDKEKPNSSRSEGENNRYNMKINTHIHQIHPGVIR
jgi:hypothetical protein